ncbi:MAG: hypothetical protein AVDCRST_MAG23-198, partial [uncultured Sphingosinicella sp.]
ANPPHYRHRARRGRDALRAGQGCDRHGAGQGRHWHAQSGSDEETRHVPGAGHHVGRALARRGGRQRRL